MVTKEEKNAIADVICLGRPSIFGRSCKLYKRFSFIPTEVSDHCGGNKTIFFQSYYQIDIYSKEAKGMIPYVIFSVKDLTHWV